MTMTEFGADELGDPAVMGMAEARFRAREGRVNPATPTRQRRKHAARKSRYLAAGLSLAAASGLVSNMWVQSAASQPVVTAGPEVTLTASTSTTTTGPEQIVYVVVRRSEAGASGDTLRAVDVAPAPTTVTIPSRAATPAPSTPAPAPVTKSHASK